MKYFKIYHSNVRTHKAYHELTQEDFHIDASHCAAENTPDILDKNGNIDFNAEEKAIDKEEERITEEAKTEYGFNAGDYNLYIRDDDFDMYDIPRENR